MLIPRQETEELVYRILETLKRHLPTSTSPHLNTSPPQHLNPPPSLLDIGTGTACIPITIKKNYPKVDVHAIDISQEALAIARENAKLNEVEIHFQQFDILEESLWPKLSQYDIIVSNPPYIPKKEKALMEKNVLQYEPELALFVKDDDPLIFYRKISAFAMTRLRAGGYLFFEVNEFSGEAVVKHMQGVGFKNCELKLDINQKARMVIGQL